MAVLSISTRSVAAAGFGLAALWSVFALATWGDLVNGPRFGSPWTTYGYGQALLLVDGVQGSVALAAFAFHLAACLIGYAWVVRPVWGRRAFVSTVWMFLAGVIPGSIILIALSRMVTVFVSNAWAPACIFALIFAACARISWRAWMARTRNGWQAPWRQLALGALALGVALIFSVHVDRGHVVGEGSVWFINEIFLSAAHGIETSGRWPLISQHYDEAGFLYPLVYGLLEPGAGASGTLTFTYWIMLAFGRVGVVALSFVALRGLGIDRLSAYVILAFVTAASLSLNPLSSRLLFDSLSPLGYTLHISRFLIAVLPLVLISAFAAMPRKSSGTALILAALAGIGLSSMPFHVILVLIWVALALGLTSLAPRAAGAEHVWRAACLACTLLGAAFALAYGIPVLPDALQVGLLLGSMVGASLLCARALLKERTAGEFQRAELPHLYLTLALCIGCLFGLVLFGNVLLNSIMPVLGKLWPWADIPVANRFSEEVYTPALTLQQSPYCERGYYWGYRTLTGHCGSLGMFARTYGLSLVCMLAVVAWYAANFKRWQEHAELEDRTLTLMLCGILLCFIAHPLGFVLYDFISAVGEPSNPTHQLSVWLRSRLLESWFYGGVMLSLALFFRYAAAGPRVWVQSALLIGVAVFSLSPLVLPAQMIANFSYLFGALLGY